MILRETQLAEIRRDSDRTTRPRTQSGDDAPVPTPSSLASAPRSWSHEDADLVQKRSAEYFKTLKPQNNFHCWLVSEIGLSSIRIDRDERIERRVRDKIVIKGGDPLGIRSSPGGAFDSASSSGPSPSKSSSFSSGLPRAASG